MSLFFQLHKAIITNDTRALVSVLTDIAHSQSHPALLRMASYVVIILDGVSIVLDREMIESVISAYIEVRYLSVVNVMSSTLLKQDR